MTGEAEHRRRTVAGRGRIGIVEVVQGLAVLVDAVELGRTEDVLKPDQGVEEANARVAP